MPDGAYKPALSFSALTALFDPVVALTARERTLKSRVLQRAALAPEEDVLDVGCGTGTLAIAALKSQPKARIAGLDADPQVLAKARRKAGDSAIRFDEGLSTWLPYESESFDVVLSTLFFHHLRDEDKVATGEEMARVLRPGGRVVVADMGRSQDPLMRAASLLTFQLLDGFETTSSSVAGKLPDMLSRAGLKAVHVTDRLRTPIGTIELLSARR